MDLAHFVVREAAEEATPECSSGNDYDGNMGLRISAIFVILVGSTLGAVFPIVAKRHKGLGVPDWAFFVAKYFGSGVIISTAFIHLLAPANEALGNPCLTGVISEYPWPEAIALMTIFVMFFLEIMTMRYGIFGGHSHDHDDEAGHSHGKDSHSHSHSKATPDHGEDHSHGHVGESSPIPSVAAHTDQSSAITLELRHKYADDPEDGNKGHHHLPGDDHLGHSRDHRENPDDDWETDGIAPESYAAQMTGIFILEFGVIFHSIFIGLTLAVSGAEFTTLYVILVFHQTFEGLGLGARLATVPWPKSKHMTPYILAGLYGISTPVAIAIGLGVRNTYPPESQTTLIVNGVFDSLSGGVLIYTGLVELMAHEFMFSPYMQKGPVGRVLGAFGLMCIGAGLMAVLGKWA